MAGHSKWANIKHRKGRADAKKGKAFSRVTKELINAVRQGGPDPKTNTKLRLAIQKAKDVNLPSENIERNIKKASSGDQTNYDEITYELYGHGGVGLIAVALTDNKNRTASDLRIATNKRGGTIATPGAVSYQFDRKGVIQVEKKGDDSTELFMIVSESGADDFEEEEGFFVVVTVPEELYLIKEAIESKGYKCLEASIEMIPRTYVSCGTEETEQNLALIEWLENLDDIDEVYHNMKME